MGYDFREVSYVPRLVSRGQRPGGVASCVLPRLLQPFVEAVLRAEAEREAAILRAEADRQAAILKAEGEAEAIRKVQQALADSIKMLNEANPNDQVVKIKALEAYEKAADGQATKIIIPSEIQSLAGLAAGFKGLLEDDRK